MTTFELSVRFFLQAAVVLLACRLVGRLVRPLGQPLVVAEMITGVLLGPSLLGWVAPRAQAWLFPSESLPVLYVVAQLGLVLYMFLVGLEFDPEHLRGRARAAAAVSVAGMVTPFALGVALALGLPAGAGLFAAGVAGWQAAVFLGAAMSITAFPMLARILYERGLAATPMGALALTAGSLNDAAAWALLAVVLAGLAADAGIAWLAIGGGATFALLLWTVGRRLLAALYRRLGGGGGEEGPWLAVTLALLALSAWTTDALGIYAVFGAFLFGAALPRGELRSRLETAIGPLTTALLLPFFFVYSGLSTRLDLLAEPLVLLAAVAVLAAATLGKGAACALAARWSGTSWREAAVVGALMNARGLMELILLDIGLERGIVTERLFSVLVLMA
ncbi:MAG TPA: cation:proton antiporter, partial [Thermoanaerobaculia bacterium]|nr:cation:proton antiporter [Thermoanaerobaculia bacterium]